MTWKSKFEEVAAELEALPTDMRAKLEHIVKLIREFGLECMSEPYVKHLENRLWEMRLADRSGIARAIYLTASGRRIVIVRAFRKDPKDTTPGNCIGSQTSGGHTMTKKTRTIPADELFAKWREDPKYQNAYEAADEEFSIAAAMIAARTQADLTQAELAERMGTTQSAIARIESGKFKPSQSTLEKYANATNTRVRIVFERRSTKRQSKVKPGRRANPVSA